MDRRDFLGRLLAGAAFVGTIGTATISEAQRWTPPDRGGFKQQVVLGARRASGGAGMQPGRRRMFMMRRRMKMMRRRMMMMRRRGF